MREYLGLAFPCRITPSPAQAVPRVAAAIFDCEAGAQNCAGARLAVKPEQRGNSFAVRGKSDIGLVTIEDGGYMLHH